MLAPLYSLPRGIPFDEIGVTTFGVLGGLLVGGVWFAFGYYGGLPLFDTVSDWQPPRNNEEITESHRRGLSTLRRRKWLMWASTPIFFVLAGLLMPWFIQIKQAGAGFLLIAVMIFMMQFHYHLSRCPRCGYGFFAGSTRRAALMEPRKYCAHCGLTVAGQNHPWERLPTPSR